MEGKEIKKDDLASEVKSSAVDYVPGNKIPGVPQMDEKAKKEIDKTKERLDEFKKKIVKKYPSTLAIGIVPPQAAEKFDEELGLTPEEKKEKPMHLVVIIPEEEYKEIGKIKAELVKEAKEIKPKLWLNIITPVDLWNYAMDSKQDIAEAIGMCYPLHDKGILGALRVAQIHKSLCLRKFEKYIYSYCIGGSLVRGEAKETSDVDVFVIIDDTDVKRMSRLELKEKLRGIIYQYVAEAGELAGVKNKLSPQVYLLTEFWEDVKDASPVIFTFIRDGIPLYDRGGFLPWKLLLKMGKIKPSNEAIDRFMSMGDKTKDIIKSKMLDIVMGDLYWSVIAPTQAVLMLYGIPPPTPAETVREMRRVFVDEEKMLEKKYTDILEKIVIKYYKGYEHGLVKEVTGTEIDSLMKDAEQYMKRLKELHIEIEKRATERTIKNTYETVFTLLKNLFGNKAEVELIKEFDKELIKKGRTDPRDLKTLHELIDCVKRYKSKKKPAKYEIEDVRKNTAQVINHLIEYGQRCELHDFAKMKAKVIYNGADGKEKVLDLFLTNPPYIISDREIKRIEDESIITSPAEQFDKIINEQKGKPQKLSSKHFIALKKEYGDFNIIF